MGQDGPAHGSGRAGRDGQWDGYRPGRDVDGSRTSPRAAPVAHRVADRTAYRQADEAAYRQAGCLGARAVDERGGDHRPGRTGVRMGGARPSARADGSQRPDAVRCRRSAAGERAHPRRHRQHRRHHDPRPGRDHPGAGALLRCLQHRSGTAPSRRGVALQAAGHRPTGVEPSERWWASWCCPT